MSVNENQAKVVLGLRVSPAAKKALEDEASKEGIKPADLGRKVFSIGFRHWMKGER